MSVFQSAAWQSAWWNTWGDTEGFQLIRQHTYPAAGLYIDRYLFKGGLPIRCLQFVGTNYRRISTPRSEYNALLIDGVGSVDGYCNPLEGISSASWSEAVFRDMVECSDDVAELRRLAERRGWLWRIVDEDTSYSVDTSGSWQDYLNGLGANTRLRLFNRRRLLAREGTVGLSDFWPDKTDDFFKLLNRFHARRWGNACFNRESLSFHQEFLKKVVDEGGVPELSVLFCADRPISVLYNVAFEGCVYNIQAGFEADFHKKLAVGTLHLGYGIEEAFNKPGISTFDLLAGEGKHENYKARLATHSQKLVSVMLVRSRPFQFLYRLKGL